MINFTLTSSDGNVIVAAVQDIRDKLDDLAELANSIATALFEQNIAARRLGLDKDGEPFADLKESTIKRRARRGDGNGPPLSPNQSDSRIQNPIVRVERISEYRYTVTLSWPEMPWLHYHVTGTPVMEARDPVGITPDGWAVIDQCVSDFVRS